MRRQAAEVWIHIGRKTLAAVHEAAGLKPPIERMSDWRE